MDSKYIRETYFMQKPWKVKNIQQFFVRKTENIFQKDDKGHEFLVGELLFDDNLKIGEDFELVN